MLLRCVLDLVNHDGPVERTGGDKRNTVQRVLPDETPRGARESTRASSELEVDLLTLPIESFGSSVFTAANGDSLFTDIIGLATPTENADVVSIVEVHTITGGTGRFAGATGGFIRTYVLNLVTGLTSGSFDGTIVIH